ncbi:MAG: hypothetical protein ACOY4Q_11910 [Bacillota bacterium]
MRERRESILVFCGILLFIIFFGVAYSRVTAKETITTGGPADFPGDKDCTGCHEMQPEIMTWQISSHSRVPCTGCHDVDPADYQGKHDTSSFTRPIKISDGIPSSVCMRCHTENREATVSGDLIIPHDRHAAAGVTCVKCHSGVVHAKIADRGLTAGGELGDYKAWNLDVARQAATKYYTQPSMWTCIGCHKQAGITRRCSACHTAIPGLPSHDLPAWKAEHGKTARANIGECTKCHVTPGVPKFLTPSTGDPAADFARAQEFCYDCHLKRPDMHEKSMVPAHPAKVAAKGIQNCLTCHDRDQQKPAGGGKTTGTYCNRCHWLQK